MIFLLYQVYTKVIDCDISPMSSLYIFCFNLYVILPMLMFKLSTPYIASFLESCLYICCSIFSMHYTVHATRSLQTLNFVQCFLFKILHVYLLLKFQYNILSMLNSLQTLNSVPCFLLKIPHVTSTNKTLLHLRMDYDSLKCVCCIHSPLPFHK